MAIPKAEEILKECIEREIMEFYRGNEELAKKERISELEFLKKQLASVYQMNAQELRLIEMYLNSYARGLVLGAAFVHRAMRTQLQTLRGF